MIPSQIQIEKIKTLSGHAAAIFTVGKGLHPNSFLSGAGDGLVAEWFIDGDDQATGIAQIPANIFSFCLIEKYHLLIIGQMRGGVHAIDLHTKKEIHNIGRTTASIFDLYFDKVTDLIYIATGDGTLYIWKIPQFEFLESIKISKESIRRIAYADDKNEFAFASSDHTIHIYEKETMQLKKNLQGHKNSVFSIAYSPDKKYLLSGSRDAQLGVWNADTYALEQMIPAHLYTINDIQFSPDHKLFATGGRDKHVKIWDAATLKLQKVLDHEKFGGHIHSVNKIFWSAYSNTLISCSDDKKIICWNIKY